MKPLYSVLLILTFCGLATFFQPAAPKPAALPVSQNDQATVLLIPLDSRPACTKFVVDLGKAANIRIIMPPPEILDHYKEAGDTAALRAWCLDHAKEADAAILSIDMLIHGGLLASRHAAAPPENIAATLTLLKTLHEDYPALPLYAFHILPRLWPADNAANNPYQKELVKYSKLLDQIYTFENPLDIKKRNELEAKIPADIIANYRRVYEENLALNKQLAAMTQNGVLKKLVIGQDDGESFGLPNLAKIRLLHYLKQSSIAPEQVFVTKGADEVALTLLADIDGQIKRTQPKVNVQYADEYTPRLVMPYMANSVATTVKEKVALLHGTIVDSPDNADFILFIYVGSDRNVGYQYVTNQRIQALLEQNYKVALVDLSQHFAADETILPVLMQNSAPINRLIAYSGWNTASNAIGMAVAQGAVFTAGLKRAATDEAVCSLYKNNLTILTNHYLEDYFYLKESIDKINASLKSEGTDIYDFKDRARWANAILKAEMIPKAQALIRSISYNRPFTIPLRRENIEAKIADLNMAVRFPWARTFEIEINTEIILEKPLTY